MMTGIFNFRWRLSGVRLSRNFCTAIDHSPIKMGYTSYDQESSIEKFQKPPILLIHGYINSNTTFGSLPKALNQLTKRRVIVPDLRNHGKSPYTPDLTYPAMTEDVKYLGENLSLKRSILMGHSMGGRVAMFTALTYPHFVDKLIVFEMNPLENSPNVQDIGEIARLIAKINFQGLRTLSEATKRADDALSSLVNSPSMRRLLLTNLKETSPEKFEWAFNVPVIIRDFDVYLTKFPSLVPQLLKKPFEKPTLFISGRHSDWLKEKHIEGIRKLFPIAEFTFLDAGHWPHLQKPEECLKIASDFINK